VIRVQGLKRNVFSDAGTERKSSVDAVIAELLSRKPIIAAIEINRKTRILM
jgi:hypothetical protein